MSNTSQTLPNQVQESEVVSIQTKQIQERIENLSKQNEEVREDNNKLGNQYEDLKIDFKDTKERIQKLVDDKEDSKLNKVIFWFACVVFTFLGGFWIYEVIVTYRAEPLMSTTSIIQNETFKWPTISIKPQSTCYNFTALNKLKKEHSLILTPTEMIPFEITNENFNWSANNVSEMYLQTKYRNIVNYTYYCKYMSSGRNETNCLQLGTWQRYDTQLGVAEAFTPVPANDISDTINFYINTAFCSWFTIALHPVTDKYYDRHCSALRFLIRRGYYVLVHVALKEYHRVSTRSSPCIEDPNYSQTQCHDEKTMEYKVKKAGCRFPGITRYQQQLEDYPECDNASSFKKFKFWHQEIYKNKIKYDDLQKKKNECGEPCHTKNYIITGISKSRRKKSKPIRFRVWLDSRAMNYQSVKSKRAMTIDILVANVGGILGLFLGISCLTAIGALQCAIRKITSFTLSWSFHRVIWCRS